jgi:hypothetical protein
MKRLSRAGLAAVAAVAIIASVAPATADAASYRNCSGSFGFNGEQRRGGVFKGVQVLRVRCPTGRRVTRSWIRTRDSARNFRTFRASGLTWRCRLRYRRIGRTRFSRGNVGCSARGARRVRFHFGAGPR